MIILGMHMLLLCHRTLHWPINLFLVSQTIAGPRGYRDFPCHLTLDCLKSSIPLPHAFIALCSVTPLPLKHSYFFPSTFSIAAYFSVNSTLFFPIIYSLFEVLGFFLILDRCYILID